MRYLFVSIRRHHCVHHPKTNQKPFGPCAITEYKDTYKKFSSYTPAQAIRPDDATRRSSQPLDSTTLYKQEYIPHELGQRQKRDPAKYVKPDGNFDGISSYQHDYFAKQADKIPSAKPQYHHKTHDRPFSGTTVHKETYKPWDLPSSHGVRPPAAIRLPTSKFDHTTTFQDDYTKHALSGRQAIKPPEPALAINRGDFADETTTRHDYTPKDAERTKSAKPPHQVLRHTGPFGHDTTCQHTYRWPDGRPASSCRPETTVIQSDVPFDEDTTHNLTYKPWELPKKQSWKPRGGWVAPSDKFDHKTTFQHDYDGKNAGPAKSARPHYDRALPGYFDSMTTHKNAFKPWEVDPRQSCRPMGGYKGPHGKFDGQTTFQTDYRGYKAKRPDLCIPKESGVAFQGPQDFSTMYRDTYLGERPPSCPAKYLEARENVRSRNGYLFKMDRRGHQFFKPPWVKDSIQQLPFSPPRRAASVEILAV